MYTADLLRRDGPKVFEGAMAFACNHDRYNKDIRSLVGQYRGVAFDESTQALKADLHILPSEEPLMEKLLAAHQMFGGEKVELVYQREGRRDARRFGRLRLRRRSPSAVQRDERRHCAVSSRRGPRG